jgi:hypothetical protein
MTTKQQRYAEKMRKAGMSEVRVWVPKEEADRLKAYARKLRLKAEKG